jgi:hypothetical protein
LWSFLESVVPHDITPPRVACGRTARTVRNSACLQPPDAIVSPVAMQAQFALSRPMEEAHMHITRRERRVMPRR